MTKRAEIREKFINAVVALGKPTVTTDEIKEICSKVDIAHPYWFTNDDANRVKRGVYKDSYLWDNRCVEVTRGSRRTEDTIQKIVML